MIVPPEFNIWIDEYHEDPPKILGEEFVGEVEEAGSNTKFKKGEKVTGFIYGGGKAHDGAYAEFSLCHKRRLYRLPETNLSWEVLGAIPMRQVLLRPLCASAKHQRLHA